MHSRPAQPLPSDPRKVNWQSVYCVSDSTALLQEILLQHCEDNFIGRGRGTFSAEVLSQIVFSSLRAGGDPEIVSNTSLYILQADSGLHCRFSFVFSDA